MSLPDHLASRLAEVLEDNAAIRAQFLEVQRDLGRQAARQAGAPELATKVVIPALEPEDLA